MARDDGILTFLSLAFPVAPSYKSLMIIPSHSIEDAVKLFRPDDTLHVALATGQPMALLNALSTRDDWQNLRIFCGLCVFPFPILMHPRVFITSGYYGPIERLLNDQGANMEYLPADFIGFEKYALNNPARIIATTVSEPDTQGFVTFGSHAGAIALPFREACKDKNRIAIAEINPYMPVIYGTPDSHDNKIHISEIPVVIRSDQSPAQLPETSPTDAEINIANHVAALIPEKATLQFGIGPIPDLIAKALAENSSGGFGIHSELISDGFLKMALAGKISNTAKGIFSGQSVFTFAFGSQALYDFLDERKYRNKRQAVCLPVSIVNNPAIIAQNKRFTSINSGLMIDFAGQVCSEAIGLRQYSGVGGQLNFVEGANRAPDGKSIICIKSTANVDGKTVSNIVPTLPPGSLVSTPRHYVQTIVTEHGAADLSGVADEKRADKLISIAHPDFRGILKDAYAEMKARYYHLPA